MRTDEIEVRSGDSDNDVNWRNFALCAEIGPDLFDGWENDHHNDPEIGQNRSETATALANLEGDHHNDPELEQQLRSLCLDCPVSWECFEAAINEERGYPLEERQGFRAGSTPHERWLFELGVTADRVVVTR
jgi:hypothetical protein